MPETYICIHKYISFVLTKNILFIVYVGIHKHVIFLLKQKMMLFIVYIYIHKHVFYFVLTKKNKIYCLLSMDTYICNRKQKYIYRLWIHIYVVKV